MGINNEAGRAYEIGRLDAIKNSEYVPDTFMLGGEGGDGGQAPVPSLKISILRNYSLIAA